MNYSLGNMLGGSNGSLNPDKLSLNLQFATDKTLTARKGPTPVFTRASTATFVGSDGLIQSAAINAARFDHDPITLACRGLLIEESRTNLLSRSEEFENLYWSPVRTTISTNATTSPNGTTTAEKLIADTTAASNHRLDRASVILALNTVYTFSVFAKADEYTGLALGVGLTVTEGVRFSLVGSGTATPVTAGYTGTIQQLGNGWYRCTSTFTSNATTADHRVQIFVGQNGSTLSYTGDGTSGIFIWGAQLEAGSFPTSYIPTTTASVVRSADVCSIASISSFYTGSGTILIGSQLNGASMLNGLCGFFTGANQISVNRLTNNTRASTNGASPALTINSGTLAATLFVKSAFAFNTNDAAFANNGVSAGTSTSVAIPSVGTFGIGTNGGQTTQSGIISEIKVFKKRLSNQKLQTLTA